MAHRQVDNEIKWAAALEIMDVFSFGVFLVNRRGHVVHTNISASAILTNGEGLHATPKKFLRAYASRDTRALYRLIERARRSRTLEGPLSIFRAEQTPLQVNILALSFPMEPAELIALFVSDPDRDFASTEDFKNLFGCTNAEAALLLSLTKGKNLHEYATEANLSLHTVRGYLKGLFTRLACRRQSDLIRIAITSVLPFRR